MISKKMVSECRKTDLYDFVLSFTPDEWTKEGRNYLRHKEHSSCIITRNKGFVWNSRNLKGRNPIDFLMAFYDYNFTEAVKAIYPLSAPTFSENVIPIKEKGALLPTPLPEPWPELFYYLCTKRGLDESIIKHLIKQQKIFLTQAGNYKNVCFYNKANRHYECIGIGSRRFKQISDVQNYWCFGIINEKAFVCESAVDAISLYQLRKVPATYISIGGSVTRKKLIEKIIAEFKEVILAVDNDAAGDEAAAVFPGLKRIVPAHKDWNEDLTGVVK